MSNIQNVIVMENCAPDKSDLYLVKTVEGWICRLDRDSFLSEICQGVREPIAWLKVSCLMCTANCAPEWARLNFCATTLLSAPLSFFGNSSMCSMFNLLWAEIENM